MNTKFAEIIVMLDEFFKDDSKLINWLHTKNPMFGEVTPIDLMMFHPNGLDYGIKKVHVFVNDIVSINKKE